MFDNLLQLVYDWKKGVVPPSITWSIHTGGMILEMDRYYYFTIEKLCNIQGINFDSILQWVDGERDNLFELWCRNTFDF